MPIKAGFWPWNMIVDRFIAITYAPEAANTSTYPMPENMNGQSFSSEVEHKLKTIQIEQPIANTMQVIREL
jgi:hypothetical protein